MFSRISSSSRSGRSSLTLQNSSQPSGLWINDDLLNQSFNRFATAVVLTRFSRSNRYGAVRHGSSLPGPFEFRRRLLKRRHNDLAHPSQLQAGVQLHQSPFELRPYLWPNLTLPRAKWLPPGPAAIPHSSDTLSSSWWHTPPAPPDIERLASQSRDTVDPFSSRMTNISVAEYSKLLSDCVSLQDIQQLHRDVANAVLDAPTCSSLAFERLITIRSALNSRNLEQTITIDHLLEFLHDPKLEHTRGSNLARLISHLSNNYPQELEHDRLIYTLVYDGLERNLFSIQALAALSANTVTLKRMQEASKPDHGWKLPEEIFTRACNQLSSLNEITQPSFKDFTALISMATARPCSPRRSASLTQFILDRSLTNFQSGQLTLDQTVYLLKKTGLLVRRYKAFLQSNKILNQLSLLKDSVEKHQHQGLSYLRLLGSILDTINGLPPSDATVTLGSKLVEEYASRMKDASPNHEILMQENVLTRTACHLLFFDTHSFSPTRVSDSSRRISTSYTSESRLTRQLSASLTLLFDNVPKEFAELWFARTSKSIINLTRRKPGQRHLFLLNSWLIAAARSKVLGQHLDTAVWKPVFDDLSKYVEITDLTRFFAALRTDMVCRTYLRISLAKYLKNDQTLHIQRFVSNKNAKTDELFTHSATQHTVESIERTYNTLKLKTASSPHARYAKSSAHCYLCLFQALAELGLRSDKVLLELLQLTQATGRPVAFSALANTWILMYGMTNGKIIYGLLNEHVEAYGSSAPGLNLGLRKQDPNFRLWKQMGLAIDAISSPKSKVHPNVIFRLLEGGKRSPGATSLAPKHVNAIHIAAQKFAVARRFSNKKAWEMVKKCLEFLELKNAPLDYRISLSLVEAGIIRHLTASSTGVLSEDVLETCYRGLEQTEGKENADKALTLALEWQKRNLGREEYL